MANRDPFNDDLFESSNQTKVNPHNPHYQSKPRKCECLVDDALAERILKLWQAVFPDAAFIAKPSQGNGVATITHTMGDGVLMKINGLPSKSPLANNALYSFECSEGIYMNLYEIMLPDIPGKHGEKSTVEEYTSLLEKYGLSVAGNHYHWYGSFLNPKATLVAAVHHQTTNNKFDPETFSKLTIRALKKTMALIDERS